MDVYLAIIYSPSARRILSWVRQVVVIIEQVAFIKFVGFIVLKFLLELLTHCVEFFQKFADEENRNLSNFILNAVLTYIKEHKDADYKKAKK